MEEDGGVKAPVTRLRRRLSVEQLDDTRSPSAPSTPTKKRGGRLAAKPQLELIKENAVQNSPKKTSRKSIARDITEPEEKTLTPARRSTRIKSNTSLLSETEEKPLTPARRNTRVTNTSIVSEATQSLDSPRAKRAVARKNSQLGSDTEATVTPARTRRTRKGSTSSIDKEGTPSVSETAVTPGKTRRTRKGSTTSIDAPAEALLAEKTTLLTTKVESSDNKNRNSVSETDSNHVESKPDSPTKRKSPRLTAKKKRKSKSEDENENGITSRDIEASSATENSSQDSTTMKSNPQNELSIYSANLIKDLDTKPKKKSSNKNKSTSNIEDTVNSENKRYRTKSWTSLNVAQSNEGNFYSDNESSKKKLKKHEKNVNKKRLSPGGSYDSTYETATKQDEHTENEIAFHTSKKYNKNKDKSFVLDKSQTLNNSSTETNKQLNVSEESNKENLPDVGLSKEASSTVAFLFENAPSSEIQSLVFIKDFNSNTGSADKQINIKQSESEDQCVPVAIQPSVNYECSSEGLQGSENQSLLSLNAVQDKASSNISCEPMDIDETIPGEISLTEFNNENNLEKSQVKQSPKCVQKTESILMSPNSSKIKLSNSISELDNYKDISNDFKSMTQGKRSRDSSVNKSGNGKSNINSSIPQAIDLEKSSNENKVNLVLSQIKDISTTDNSLSKSLRVSNERLSLNMSEVNKEGPVNKALIQKYLTSTPVQQKNIEKLGLQMNSSKITPNHGNKAENKQTTKTSKKDISNTNSTSKSFNDNSSADDSENSEEESIQDKSNFLADEAEDAGDGYESGDSQDDEERQYLKENEILEKGETLTSEDEVSNDSDYEKDSFVVSCDEEDNELLSGSGDDLDMSDNELTMSAKSKKKYDERKAKEQKKASREMFESRHKMETSEKYSKLTKNRLRLDSSLLETREDLMVPPKKNKRMRLESTLDDSEEITSTNISATSEVDKIGCKKKKSKRLSESIYNESTVNEKEMTICTENTTENEDPLLINIKSEPKTPQKGFDISTVLFTDREEIEEVEVDNVSMLKSNETSDPLQTTAVQDEDSDDDASISENEEITKNYDSVLETLNMKNKKHIKTHDISLNFNKKTLQKPKVAIVEELNLTQSKTSQKKTKVKPEQSNNEKAVKRVFKKLADADDASSDSIDLKLLFSDDSHSGYDKDNSNTDSNINSATDRFITLERKDGKTNLRENMDVSDVAPNESVLNNSTKKKNKNRKSKNDVCDIIDNNGEEFRFFVDTKGDLPDEETAEKATLNTSTKKKSKKSLNMEHDDDRKVHGEDSIDAPIAVPYQSEKNKNRSKSFCENITEDINVSNVNHTPGSQKKKKNLSESHNDEMIEPVVAKEPASEKKNKKYMESPKEEMCVPISEIPVPRTPTSQIKNKKKVSPSHKNETEMVEHVAPVPKTPLSGKKMKNIESCKMVSILADEIIDAKSELNSDTKKRKRNSSANNNEILSEDSKVLKTTLNVNESIIGNEKKKRKVSSNIAESDDIQNNGPKVKVNKKRKLRDDDEENKKKKILKENSLDKIHVPRLPPNIIEQLDEKPRNDVLRSKKANIVSTSNFIVEETKKRKNKPSNFLEETVCLNDDTTPALKKKVDMKKPKVLPFLPTVSISDRGFTTNFQVNVLCEKMEFIAQKSDMPNFKNEYLSNKRVKKLQTYDLYKKHRNLKLSKF